MDAPAGHRRPPLLPGLRLGRRAAVGLIVAVLAPAGAGQWGYGDIRAAGRSALETPSMTRLLVDLASTAEPIAASWSLRLPLLVPLPTRVGDRRMAMTSSASAAVPASDVGRLPAAVHREPTPAVETAAVPAALRRRPAPPDDSPSVGAWTDLIDPVLPGLAGDHAALRRPRPDLAWADPEVVLRSVSRGDGRWMSSLATGPARTTPSEKGTRARRLRTADAFRPWPAESTDPWVPGAVDEPAASDARPGSWLTQPVQRIPPPPSGDPGGADAVELKFQDEAAPFSTYLSGRQQEEARSATAFGREIEGTAGVEYAVDEAWAYRFQVAQPFVNDLAGTSEAAQVSLLLRLRF